MIELQLSDGREKDEKVWEYGQVEIIILHEATRTRRLEDTTFTKATKILLMRGLPVPSSLVAALICKPRMSVGEAISKLEFGLFNGTIGTIGPKSNRCQVAVLNDQKSPQFSQ